MNAESSPPLPYKDRTTALAVFGIATLLLGCCSGFMASISLLTHYAQAHHPAAQPRAGLLPVAFMEAAMAITFIWLGIGSIKARRWARALLVILSWSWLITVIGVSAMLTAIGPQLVERIKAAQPPHRPELSAAAQASMMLGVIGFLTVIFVVLPLISGLFYSSRNVKLTCEARDPVMRWTDRCPLPVLAMVLWLAFGAVGDIGIAFTKPALPFFGIFILGREAAVCFTIMALIGAYCAWSLYHLDRRGWWIIVVAMALRCLSNLITYAQHDATELYRQMGYSAARIAELQKFGLPPAIRSWFPLFSTIPFLGYLLYLRRFLAFSRHK